MPDRLDRIEALTENNAKQIGELGTRVDSLTEDIRVLAQSQTTMQALQQEMAKTTKRLDQSARRHEKEIGALTRWMHDHEETGHGD